MPILKLLMGGNSEQSWPIDAPIVLIGRDDQCCTVVLNEPSISRKHAAVVCEANQYSAIDLGSRSGTKLNGKRMEEQRKYPLKENDLIQIRNYVFGFVSHPIEQKPGGSVTFWIRELNEGEEDRAQMELVKRYFGRLTALARTKLVGISRGVEDEEDVVLCALHSFFSGADKGRFKLLADRNDLWSLLATITVRKAINQRNKHSAQKRGSGKVRHESVFLKNDGGQGGLDDIAGASPAPDLVAELSEESRHLMDQLPDDLRSVADMKLDGHTQAEIAKTLGIAERTVERRVNRIREIWSATLDDSIKA